MDCIFLLTREELDFETKVFVNLIREAYNRINARTKKSSSSFVNENVESTEQENCSDCADRIETLNK